MHCRRTYNLALRQSLGSKLFFVQHLPVSEFDLVLDYGCADGALLKALSRIVPEDCLLLGIDSDPQQLKAARQLFVEGDGFHTDWEVADGYLGDQAGTGRSLLVLSSVLHEIASTGSIEQFWVEVEARGFDYIAIRDMAVPASYHKLPTPADWLHALAYSEPDMSRIQDHAFRWGDLGSLASFVHFLLKQPYRADWAREHSENYLARSAEELTELLTLGPYRLVHSEPTITPHFKGRVWNELGIDLAGITTHIEIILEHERVRMDARRDSRVGEA